MFSPWVLIKEAPQNGEYLSHKANRMPSQPLFTFLSKLLKVLTVFTCEVVLFEEAVGEESDVLGNVLRQKLRQGAGDSVRLDGESDAVLGPLHEPGVVVNDRESSLRALRLLGTLEDGGGASVSEDCVKDRVIDVVVERGVDGGQLHADHQGELAWVSLFKILKG